MITQMSGAKVKMFHFIRQVNVGILEHKHQPVQMIHLAMKATVLIATPLV